jgi:TetR/AcrR family transcriptional regulator, regulator of cefoperazone and chloramphenicol sensitivity
LYSPLHLFDARRSLGEVPKVVWRKIPARDKPGMSVTLPHRWKYSTGARGMNEKAIFTNPADLTGRARLRDAALKLFAERGVAASTVRDIAEAAGVTAGLITHHFGSKERLKAEIDALMVRVFTEPLEQSFDGPADQHLVAVTAALARTMATYPDLRRYLRRSFLEDDPASTLVFNRFVTQLRDMQCDMKRTGLLREDLDTDWAPFQVLFLHFGSLLFGPAVERILGVDPYSDDVIQRRSRATFELLTRGVLRQPVSKPGDLT